MLGKFFASVFTDEPDGVWELLDKPKIKHCVELNITEEVVMKKLNKIRISKSPGPDGIHPRVLSELKSVLVTPLTLIFRASLEMDQIPDKWNEANITAFYKKGNKHTTGNYRPISLTSICCKIMESIIRDVKAKYMKDNLLFSKKAVWFDSRTFHHTSAT